MITHRNYHNNTSAVFKGCKKPKREPNFVSESGSMYWEGSDSIGKYVIRYSDHWTKYKEIGSNEIKTQCRSIASCLWGIKTNEPKLAMSLLMNQYFAAKAYLADFKKI